MHNSVKVEVPESKPTVLGDLIKGQVFSFDDLKAGVHVYMVTSNIAGEMCVQVVSLQSASLYSLDRTKPCTPVPPYATITIRTYL